MHLPRCCLIIFESYYQGVLLWDCLVKVLNYFSQFSRAKINENFAFRSKKFFLELLTKLCLLIYIYFYCVVDFHLFMNNVLNFVLEMIFFVFETDNLRFYRCLPCETTSSSSRRI